MKKKKKIKKKEEASLQHTHRFLIQGNTMCTPTQKLHMIISQYSHIVEFNREGKIR